MQFQSRLLLLIRVRQESMATGDRHLDLLVEEQLNWFLNHYD